MNKLEPAGLEAAKLASAREQSDYFTLDAKLEAAILAYIDATRTDTVKATVKRKASAIKPLPPQELLCALFIYHPETGEITHASGRTAFTTRDRLGYLHGKVRGTNYLAHRVIWKMVFGVDPDRVDHINGVQSDNRLCNLRDCSAAENSRNYSKPPGNTSKYRGVHWVSRDKAWTASISAGKLGRMALGYFPAEIDAAMAYDEAAKKHHGEFATLNFPQEVSDVHKD